VKIERYINDQGEFRAFGFPNTFVGKVGVRDILLNISDVEVTHFCKEMFTEEFCTFVYSGRRFSVIEPYGDNSYYDVICEDPDTAELEQLYQHFAATKLPTPGGRKRLIAIGAMALVVLGIIFLKKVGNAP